MRYKILLGFLKVLIYCKRALWFLGAKVVFVFVWFFSLIWRFIEHIRYKVNYFLHRLGWGGPAGSKLFSRDFLQVFVLAGMFFIVFPQTGFFTRKGSYLPGQQTIAYNLFDSNVEVGIEEIVANPNFDVAVRQAWREGALTSDSIVGYGNNYVYEQELATVVAGGAAFSKPVIMPGSVIGGTRDKVVEYEVEPGDSLSGIAYQFGVSVATVMWENNLGMNSILRLGDKLKIPPTTGVMHTVKKGDTIGKIAKTYGATQDDIVNFNKIKEDGSDLKVGERIMVPNGIKPQAAPVYARTTQSNVRVATPASSRSAPSSKGFVWPTAARTITQYYNWLHHGLDIAGPMATPNYAAKAGTVVISQCGWNSGYGCYIVIDHGGGVKTLYGHHSKLLVSKGDYVEAGQTIGLMGNTGKVRGVTGIHLHFEIQINGVRVNPLGYVR